jgi:hypothetical protein
MVKFKNIVMEPTAVGEEQGMIRLDNGLEVSIVRNELSHGGKKGLYEMGVFEVGGKRMKYIDEWNDQVKGWLTPEDVDRELAFLEECYSLDTLEKFI